MGNSNNNTASKNDENMAPENISGSRAELGCFCIGNGNVDISNEMYLNNDMLPIS